MSPDYDTILAHLRASYAPGEVFEIRVIYRYTGRCSVGYFNDHIAAANAACQADGHGVAGIYTTINAVHPDCMHRAFNRMIDAKAGSYTKDKEILYRHSVFMDVDPHREVSGISSNDNEHEEALKLAFSIDATLQMLYGFPPACIIDSGNGAHIEWQTEPIENTPENAVLIQRFLQQTRNMFQTPTQELDVSNFNASRIKRLPGSWARKGENSPDRPHRLSRIIVPHDPLARRLSRSLIESLSGPMNGIPYHASPLAPAAAPTGNDRRFENLSRHALTRLHDWVPYMIGDIAYASGEGYRIKAENLNPEYQEDVSITPFCITNFGPRDMGDPEKGKRTAVRLLADIKGITQDEAADQLALMLKRPVSEFDMVPMTPPPVANGHHMPDALLGGIEARLEDYISKNLADTEFEEKPDIIGKLIPINAYGLIHADGKVGKSTMSRQIAVAVATGMDFMDLEIVTPGEVLYVTYEEDEAFWRDRFIETHRWMLARNGEEYTHEKGKELIKKIHLIANPSRIIGGAKPKAVDLPTGESCVIMIQKYLERNPQIRLVILDPYTCIFTETYSKDIRRQDRTEGQVLKRIYGEADVSVLVVDHARKDTSKNDPSQFDVLGGASGSAQKGATTDFLIGIKALPIFPVDDPERNMLAGTKLAYMEATGRKIPTSFYKLQFKERRGWINLPPNFNMPKASELREASSSRAGASLKDPQIHNKIVTFIRKEGPKTIRQMEAMFQTLSYQIVRNAAQKLVEEGALKVSKTFNPHQYYIPDEKELRDIL